MSISHINTPVTISKTSNDPGLLTNEITAVIQREKDIAHIGELMLVGRKGLFTLNMLYDWWIIYASKKGLINDNKWIFSNDVLDALLADEYLEFGVIVGKPYHIQTYLRMLGKHLKYNYQLNFNTEQYNYLNNQINLIRNVRKEQTTFMNKIL